MRKVCNCFVYTDISIKHVLTKENEHNHLLCTDTEINIERIRCSIKRKATEDYNVRPSKALKMVLRSCDEEIFSKFWTITLNRKHYFFHILGHAILTVLMTPRIVSKVFIDIIMQVLKNVIRIYLK